MGFEGNGFLYQKGSIKSPSLRVNLSTTKLCDENFLKKEA